MATRLIEANIDEVLADLGRLSGREQDKAMRRSLNRTIRGVRTDASREIRSELNLKARDVNRTISVQRARGRATTVALDIRARPMNLINFGARETKRGVSVKVKKRGSRTRIKRAFIAKGRSGNRLVFERQTRSRFPLRSLQSTAPAQFFDDERVIQRIGEKARERLVKELQRESIFRSTR